MNRIIKYTILITSLVILVGAGLWWYTFYSVEGPDSYDGNAPQQGYIIPTDKLRFQLRQTNSEFLISMTDPLGQSVVLDASKSEPMQLFFQGWGSTQGGELVPPDGCDLLKLVVEANGITMRESLQELDTGLECLNNLQLQDI
jgi:hypothetical protein